MPDGRDGRTYRPYRTYRSYRARIVTSRKSNASRTRRSIREAADERSVDMDEPTDPGGEPDSRPPVIAAATRLSPLQEAWGAYTGHATTCAGCRDIDRGRCTTGEGLYRTYQQHGEQAYERLAEQKP